MRGDFDALLPLRKHESACVIFDDVDPKEAWPETFQAILKIERGSLRTGLARFYAQGTALFIDNGYIAQESHEAQDTIHHPCRRL